MNKKYLENASKEDLTEEIMAAAEHEPVKFMKDRLKEVLDEIDITIVDKKIRPVFNKLNQAIKVAMSAENEERHEKAFIQAQTDLIVALQGVVDADRVPTLASNILTIQASIIYKDIIEEQAAAPVRNR